MSAHASRLELKSSTSYGTLERGSVERPHHSIRVLVESPFGFDPERDDTVVISHGLTATAEMYARPSRRFCKLGYRVVRTTFDHTRLADLRHPIRSCAEDTESVVEAFKLSHYRLVGHSMGTVANILAVPHLEHLPDALVQINAAMIVPQAISTVTHAREIAAELGDARADNDPEWAELMEIHGREYRSVTSLARMGAQALRLAGGHIMPRYQQTAENYPAMALVGVVTPGDSITPYAGSKAALEKVGGLTVVSIGPTEGRSGHLSFCRNEDMTEVINNKVNLAVLAKRLLVLAA